MNKKQQVFFLPWQKKEDFSLFIDKIGLSDFIKPKDFVAIKIHFGEKDNIGYVKPEFVRPIIRLIKKNGAKGYLTDTGTIYSGERSNAVNHLALASQHGFSETRLHIPIVIADGVRGRDYRKVAINGRYFKEVKIAAGICDADTIIAVSHFKGHLLAGFGGAIKNLGMGCAARSGKFLMHSSVAPTVSPEKCIECGLCISRCSHSISRCSHKALQLVDSHIVLNKDLCAGCGECVVACKTGALSITWSEGARQVQEKIVEYAIGAVSKKKAFYLNFINHVTPNCDCMSKDETPLVDDIGIVAATDPVAIDQASLDLVKKAGGDVFKKTYPDVDSTIQLGYAEEMGLGSREYELVTIP